MTLLQYTLLADGTSDRALMNVIDWTLQDLLPMVSVSRQFADLGSLIKPPPLDRLDLRIQKAVDLYPCDILFVHRDCEGRTKKDFIERLQEIALAVEKGNVSNRTVSIVPIRMMEAWLLFDPQAIKLAAGNKNYRPPISLPKHKDLENLSNPKQMLHHLLKEVSGRKGRELSKFNVQQAVYLVSEYIEDFSILRQLPAYECFETELKQVLQESRFLPYS